MMNTIWYSKNKLCYLLWPFSLLYCLVISIRKFFYKIKLFKTHHVNAPVIVVGNITTGGTGKTPLVITLVNELKQQGYQPGIILRGYRGKSKTWPQFVDVNSDPLFVGDEAVLLAKKTNAPVMAGPNRVLSAKKLIAEHHCNVIVSDDGLQHDALYRDIEIVIIDGVRRFGNGFCLPAGPLREPLSRLKSVDLIVTNGKTHSDEYEMQFVVDDIVSLSQNAPAILSGSILAIAGIGNPDRFFESLRSLHLTFETQIFPDHYQFQKKDFELLNVDIILMTEKDAIKCRDFFDERFYVVMGHAIVDNAVYDFIVQKLNTMR